MREKHLLDLFCGAGGTATGAIEAVQHCGYAPRVRGVNHWVRAKETFELNHPDHEVLRMGVDHFDSRKFYKAGQLWLLIASPECTHHSTARGGRPINDQSRATAWCVVRIAEQQLPPHIFIENVPEFLTWGPLLRVRVKPKPSASGSCSRNSSGDRSKGEETSKARWEWRPDPKRKGETFKAWVAALQSLGYRVEWRVQCSADWGDPTTRERLIVQAVRGNRRIFWPKPTHAEGGGGGLLPWVPAEQIIDWSIPCPSIFERERPLKPKTVDRIFEGLERFGLGPFVVCMEHGGTVRNANRPLPTITTAKGGAMGIVQPFVVQLRGTAASQVKNSARGLNVPLGTITAGGTHHALVRPYLVQVSHGNGKDQNANRRRVRSVDKPLPTVCGTRGEWALCQPLILPQQSGGRVRGVDEPLPTISGAGAVGLFQPFVMKYCSTGGARSIEAPFDTVTTRDRFGLVRPIIEVDGEKMMLDVGFRMLATHEAAAAQGFRPDYQFSGTKTEQMKLIGNAVTRRLARAHVTAILRQNEDVSDLAELQ